MSWIFLFFAGLLEIGWGFSMKQSHGFTKLVPSLATLVLMVGSIGLLSLALKQLPLSTAYAVWTGIGAVGTAIVGIAVLGESRDPIKLVCIGLIAVGIIGLKFFAKE